MAPHQSWTYEERRERIQRAIDLNLVTIAFQPVANLRSGTIVGVEALARFHLSPSRTPDKWFEEAWSVGLGAELELIAVRKAIRQLDELPRECFLALNCDARTLASRALADVLTTIDARRIVLELTEHSAVENYDLLNTAVARLRAVGVRLAIDDVGAGFASLQHVLKLQPDIIKLDTSLTAEIDRNPVRAALAKGLIAFAASLGATVCAEGIETAAQLVALQKLGVASGQGYFLARPTPLPLAVLPKGLWPSMTSALRDVQDVAPEILDRSRLDALSSTGLMDDDAGDTHLDQLSRLVASVIGSSIALVSLVDSEHQYFKGAHGLRSAELRSTPLSSSLCQHVVAMDSPLIIEDAREHPMAANNPCVDSLCIGAYLGVPIVDREKHVLGALCAIEHAPRQWTEAEVSRMRSIASLVSATLTDRQSLTRLREQQYLNEQLFKACRSASIICDITGKIRIASGAMLTLSGYGEGELEKRRARTLFAHADLEEALHQHRRVLLGEFETAGMRGRLLRKDGTEVSGRFSWTVVRDAAGQARYTVLTVDIDEASSALSPRWSSTPIGDRVTARPSGS